ncbi:MAG: choice-of-anchor I family protein [Fimbriimonadales bacterium]|nr:choice-of-anchor I family protein [Fimbriimonadales bacterium]
MSARIASMVLGLASLSWVLIAAKVDLEPAQTESPIIRMRLIGRYESGVFGKSAAEIVAHHPRTQRLYVVNAESGRIDVVDIKDPRKPKALHTISMESQGGVVNSVAVHGDIIAVAVEANKKTNPGRAVFMNPDGGVLASVQVGAQPDMICFTPDGRYCLTADEGEPNSEYTIDPEGTVTVIDLSGGISGLKQENVRTAHFRDFRRDDLDPQIRIYGPNASIAQDLEPEYIAISSDSTTAWVTLQENNAIAVIDIPTARVKSIKPLGLKDHSRPGNELGRMGANGIVEFRNWPFFGMFQPDSIAFYSAGGKTYLVTANEGDSRDWAGYSEEVRLRDVKLDPRNFPNAGSLQQLFGDLRISKASGDTNGDGMFNEIHLFGARSFSIWDEELNLVFDSGADFEIITAGVYPFDFNSNNSANKSADSRSLRKGPEPEGVVIGNVFGRDIAFIGLERIGGVVMYDISDPTKPAFLQYVNFRDFSAPAESAGDLGAEGVTFVAATDSPTGLPLLLVAHEVSGSVSIYELFDARTRR